MSVSLTAGTLAIAQSLQTQFLASGGTPPYTYSVVPGGAGGTIDASTGVYTAPTASFGVDQVNVVGSLLGESGSTTILVGSPLQLFCDIIQNQMALGNGRVYLWDQKIEQPKDYNLYVAVSVVSCKPFGNTLEYNSDDPGMQSIQSVNMQARVGIDIISRGPDARNRKEEVIMALMSQYSQFQQTFNSFYIAPISVGFQNLSLVDGAAIPYRFHIEVQMQYFVKKLLPVQYFDTFSDVSVVTEA